MNERDLKRASRESIASGSSNPAIERLDPAGNPKFAPHTPSGVIKDPDLPKATSKPKVNPSLVTTEVQSVVKKLK